MKKLIYLLPVLSLSLFACKNDGEKEEEKVVLSSFKEKLSYALGADHAHSISESQDPYFDKYNVDELVKGFEAGVKNEKAFDEACNATMRKLYGPQGQTFDTTYVKEGSNCLGKLSGIVFLTSWKSKKALEKIDLKTAAIGFRHALLKKDTLIKKDEQANMIRNFFEDLNKMNGTALMEKAKKIPGAQVTPSGIVLETIKPGTGGKPAPGDDVLAHYILMNSLGDTLQSSFEMVKVYNQPLNAFSLNGVVPGWQEGMPMMQKGGTYRLYLPFNLAYGEQGMFNPNTGAYDIQPYESLYFYVELIDYGKPGSLTKKNVNPAGTAR